MGGWASALATLCCAQGRLCLGRSSPRLNRARAVVRRRRRRDGGRLYGRKTRRGGWIITRRAFRRSRGAGQRFYITVIRYPLPPPKPALGRCLNYTIFLVLAAS